MQRPNGDATARGDQESAEQVEQPKETPWEHRQTAAITADGFDSNKQMQTASGFQSSFVFFCWGGLVIDIIKLLHTLHAVYGAITVVGTAEC